MKINYSEEHAVIEVNDAKFHFTKLSTFTSAELTYALRKQKDAPDILAIKIRKYLDKIEGLYTDDDVEVKKEDLFKFPSELIYTLFLRLLKVASEKGNRIVDPIEQLEKNGEAQ